MGSPTANVTRNNFDPLDLYAQITWQQGVPIFDNDLNEGQWVQTFMRQMGLLGLALLDKMGAWAGWTLVQGTPNTNNFGYKPGHVAVQGFDFPHRALLPSGSGTTFQYEDLTSSNLNRVSDGIITATNGGANQITDENKSWKTQHYLASMNGFRVVMLTGAAAGTAFTISGFTVGTGTLTLSGGIGAIAVNDRYMIIPPALTTPGGGRTDTVYLMTFIEDTNSAVDTDIDDPATLIESVHKFKTRCALVVDEGTTNVFVSEASASFPQDPRLVRFTKLATFARLAANNTITTNMIVADGTTQAALPALSRGFEVNHVGDATQATFGYHDVINQPDADLNWTCNSASNRSININNSGGGRLDLTLTDGNLSVGGTLFLLGTSPQISFSGASAVWNMINGAGESELFLKNPSAGAGTFASLRAGKLTADTSENGVGVVQGEVFAYGSAHAFAKRYDFAKLVSCMGAHGILSGGGNLIYNNAGDIRCDLAGGIHDFVVPIDINPGWSVVSVDLFYYMTGGTDSIVVELRQWAMPGTAIGAALATWTGTTRTGAYVKESFVGASGPWNPAADASHFLLVTIGNDGAGAGRSRIQAIQINGTITSLDPVTR